MGMIGVNFSNLAILNGGSIHIVYKTFKKDQHVKTHTYYFKTKEDAMDTIVSALDCTSYTASDLISMVYGRYDEQGHAVEFLILYDKDGRCEE